MKATTKIVLASLAGLSIAACNESEESLDTSYEEELPAPVQEIEEPGAPVPDNDSIEGGADEQVDAMAAGANEAGSGE